MPNWLGENLKPTRDSFWAYIFYRLCFIAALRARALGVNEVAMETIHPGITGRASGDDLEPLAVTFKVASRITGLGLTTLWKLAKENRIEIVRVGRRTLPTYRGLKRLLLLEPTNTQQPRRRGRPLKTSPAQESTSHGP
jgi:hypothetical protein